MTKKQMLILEYAVFLLTAVCIIATVASFFFIRSCGVAPKKENKTYGECSKEGEVKQGECPAGSEGRIFQICKANKWEESFNDCKVIGQDCKATAFNPTIKTIIEEKCVSCHSTYSDFGSAKSVAEGIVKRVALGENDPNRMPKKPNPPLGAGEVDLFEKWKADGFLENCPDDQASNIPHISFDYVENAIESDLRKQNSSDQENSRYLVIADQSNVGASKEVLRQFVAGIQKSTNSLSAVRGIVLAKAIDQYGTIYRINLKDFGLEPSDWNLVEAEPVNLESFTDLGILIKQQTQTRKAWMHLSSFAFQANQAQTYYGLLKTPQTFAELEDELGVDFIGDQDNFDAEFVGFANSPISLNKNRLLMRFRSDDGSAWITADTIGNVTPERNLFEFPLLRSASGTANFVFDAAEMIYALPNGLHGYVLFSAQGQRQDAAPLNIVADNVTEFSPEIRNSLSCYRCHNGGFIIARDEIRRHVDQNAAQFDLLDVDLVDALYKDPAPYFEADNNQYRAALSKMGIAPEDPDPVNLASDSLRQNKNAKEVAALLFLTEQQFLNGLSRSAEGRAQVGTLLTGGTITFEQLLASLPVLRRDLKIGQNPQ